MIEAGSKLCVQGNLSTTKCILVRVYTIYEAMTYQSFAKKKKKQLFPISKKSFQPSYANWVLRVYFPQMYHRKNLIN